MSDTTQTEPQTPSPAIAAAIASGHYVLTETGKRILEEGCAYVNLSEWNVLDATSNGFLDMTEAGKQAHDEEMNRLVLACSRSGKPPQSSPQSYFFPEKNLNPEWAAREMRYHLREAEKIRRYCAGEPNADPIREAIAVELCSQLQVLNGNTQVENTYRRVTFGFLNELAWETQRGTWAETRDEANLFMDRFKGWLRDLVMRAGA